MEYIKSFTLRLSRVAAIRQRNPQREDNFLSSAREATDMAQLMLPAVRAAADAIPIAGGPLKATIGGLLTMLEAIDARNQNKSDLEQLRSKVRFLAKYLEEAPSPRDAPETQFRKDLESRLNETSRQLTELTLRKGLRLAQKSVTNALANCGKDINDFLMQYSVALSRIYEHGQLQDLSSSINEMREVIMQGQMNSLSYATLASVTLADASGREHTIPIEYTTSLEQLRTMLGVIFKGNFPGVHVLKRYFESSRYNLCIDQGPQVVQLTSDAAEWPSIETGTKLMMRVIFDQEQTNGVYQPYECPLCNTRNFIFPEVECGFLTRGSIECQGCAGCLQLFGQEGEGEIDHTPQVDDVDNVTRACIRNFRVNIIKRPRLHRSCSESTYCLWSSEAGFELCGTEISCRDLVVHLRGTHGVRGSATDRIRCKWMGCDREISRKSTMRHVREVHMGNRRGHSGRTISVA